MNVCKRMFCCLFFIRFCFCHAEKPANHFNLIPYELDGKIGFLNQDMERIAEPKYKKFTEISRYCAVVQTVAADWMVVTFDGTEIPIKSVHNSCLIGDEYFADPEKLPENSGHRIKTTICSVVTDERHVIYDLELSGGTSLAYIHVVNPYDRKYARHNYINYSGKFKFPADNKWKRLYQYDETYERCVVWDEEFDCRLVDKSGNFIKDLKWDALSQYFSEGLVAGRQNGREGYYNAEGELSIPVIFHVNDDMNLAPSFNSGVLPCRFFDNMIHIYSDDKISRASDWAVIDAKGNVLVSGITASYIEEFSEDVAVLYSAENPSRERHLIRKDGTILTKEPFDEIQRSSGGYCRARRNGEDYLISSEDGTAYKCKDF